MSSDIDTPRIVYVEQVLDELPTRVRELPSNIELVDDGNEYLEDEDFSDALRDTNNELLVNEV